jgi:hypothetical protein
VQGVPAQAQGGGYASRTQWHERRTVIRLIQLVFSAETVFSLIKKSANSVFQQAYNSSRTAPWCGEPSMTVASNEAGHATGGGCVRPERPRRYYHTSHPL